MKMWKILQQVILIYFFVKNVAAVIDITIDQSLLHSGFHRTLVTNITLYGNLTSCRLLTEEKFTKNVFINQDSLDDFNNDNSVHSKLSEQLNVEKPVTESAPFSLFVFLNSSEPVTTSTEFRTTYLYKLPFHVRYHDPKSEGGFREFKKGPVVLYARCPAEAGLPKTSVSKLPCRATTEKQCDWSTISFTQKQLLPALQVPVGNTDVFQYVFSSSHIAAYIGVIFILYSLFAAKN